MASVHNRQDLKKALELIKKGKPVGVYNRGVCAIWGNGEDARFYSEVSMIKGEARGKKPLALTIKTKKLVPHIDLKKLHKNTHFLFKDTEDLILRIGSLCFIRVPIKKSSLNIFPKYVVANDAPVVQNWDAFGHGPLESFLKVLEDNGISYPAVTSMNVSGQPEIVDQEEGVAFAKQKKIELFLADEKDPGVAKGSFTILDINRQGISLVRDGNVPGYVFSHLLETKIDTEKFIESKFTRIEFPANFFEGLSPAEARRKIISNIYKT